MNVIWGDTDNGATDEEPKPKFTYEANATGVSIIYAEGKGVINLPSYDNNGNKITRIEAGAFAGQTEITEVIIPVSVTYIDPEAFSECIGLEKITYLGAYTEYRSENGVLYGDYGKSIVKYPEGKKDPGGLPFPQALPAVGGSKPGRGSTERHPRKAGA